MDNNEPLLMGVSNNNAYDDDYDDDEPLEDTTVSEYFNVPISENDGRLMMYEESSSLLLLDRSSAGGAEHEQHRLKNNASLCENNAEVELAHEMSTKINYYFREKVPEATGFNLFIAGQACLTTSFIYFSTALLELAELQAGCHNMDDDNDDPCESKVWGLLKPSSLITAISTFVSLGSSLILPVVGAVIDHTSYRKNVGEVTAYMLIALNAAGIAISVATFPFMIAVFVLNGYLFAIHSCVASAYLPDLKLNSPEMSRYSSYFNVLSYIVMLLFLSVVFGFQTGFDLCDVDTSRTAQTVVVPSLIVFWIYPWRYLFTSRPQLQVVPEGQSLFSTGFISAGELAFFLNESFPDLRDFIISLMLSNAGVGAMLAISTTYMKEQLAMSTMQIAATFFIATVSAGPGALASKYVNKRYDPLRSYRLYNTAFVLSTLLAVGMLKGEDMWFLIYPFSVVWGFSFGFKGPVDITIYTTIIPHGRESEMMGIKALCVGALTWAPTLLITLLNEYSGVAMNYCLALLSLFFFIAVVVSLRIESYKKAMKHAKKYDRDHDQAGIHTVASAGSIGTLMSLNYLNDDLLLAESNQSNK